MNWLVNLWHLWKRSAQYLLPGFLFLPGVRFKWSNGFKLDSLETLSSFDTPVDFAKEIGRKPLDVTLGPAFFLTRSINVPLKAKSDADGILKLNLQSALPLALSTVEWRNCLSSRSTDVLNYQQYIVKRNQVTEVEGLLKALGASLRTLSLDVPYAISPIIDNRRKN